jgi:[glutamine synthetase] adenylyltransferase / [glutamine synthetase]-adenylyl-L-tyrosine phosphorylase
VPGGRCAILGFGKLGSFEMTATSDLDLVLVYDFDETRPESDGARPLNALVYYTRLTHRLVAALTAPLRHGRLYDVDMRLRPSGGKGPVAVQFDGFVGYQRAEAETWEHMALTRARAVAGDASLRAELTAAIADILRAPRDPARIAADVRTMRILIAAEKGDDDPFDLKLARGGLIDLEFLAQYLCLACAHACPALLVTQTAGVFAAAGAANLIGAADAASLAAAHAQLSAVTQIVRLTVGDRADPAALASGVKARIARISGMPDFTRFDAALAETRAAARKIFDRLLAGEDGGRPARLK